MEIKINEWVRTIKGDIYQNTPALNYICETDLKYNQIKLNNCILCKLILSNRAKSNCSTVKKVKKVQLKITDTK